jgi:triose/dihydroxyacetone kinase / FAD-AMP lyase (cyclizing)
MKKLINDPKLVTREMLEGLVQMNPNLALLGEETVVVRSDLEAWRKKGHVAIISGGGAGHEPAHAGYVGEGMLTGAVSGEVFTSPSTDAVLSAIHACATPAGVLLIIKNYTGDRLNFGLAAELARVAGIQVEMVIVADDAAFADRSNRRGIAGTVFVHKVAGAAASAGLPLEEVKREAAGAADAVRTMGVALCACTVPAVGSPGFQLADEEIELGLGIHGEKGVRRAPLVPADEIAAEIVNQLVSDLAPAPGASLALLVNNLGATPLMELYIVARAAMRVLHSRGLRVERAWCGTFLSAIDMAGCSISIMPLDTARLALLEAPTAAAGWITVPGAAPRTAPLRIAAPEPASTLPKAARTASTQQLSAAQTTAFTAALKRIAAALIAAESHLTALDQAVGDGDLGVSMSRAARAILDHLDTLSCEPAGAALANLSNIVRRAIAGSSGPFYAIGLGRAAACLNEGGQSPQSWAVAFKGACDAISELGGAKAGDRTMLDALYPAAAAFRTALDQGSPWLDAVKASATAAERGAQATANLVPRRGRSVYIGERALGSPDPGAEAIAVWLRAISG